ncbi:MAG: hypothetical protein HC862_02470 [Scytonema sp. RU_4_4]|nr:hypothetical protein [Scytonema sp. RU_4_4]NJR72996.1 hypothetical protein [Scytonema sp. CRU_2_7]
MINSQIHLFFLFLPYDAPPRLTVSPALREGLQRQMLYLGRHARWHSRRNLRNALAPQDRTGSSAGDWLPSQRDRRSSPEGYREAFWRVSTCSTQRMREAASASTRLSATRTLR